MLGPQVRPSEAGEDSGFRVPGQWEHWRCCRKMKKGDTRDERQSSVRHILESASTWVEHNW